MDDNRSNDKVRVFRDRRGEWRWTRRAANNKIISTSGEGYRNKSYAIEIANSLNADVTVDVED